MARLVEHPPVDGSSLPLGSGADALAQGGDRSCSAINAAQRQPVRMRDSAESVELRSPLSRGGLPTLTHPPEVRRSKHVARPTPTRGPPVRRLGCAWSAGNHAEMSPPPTAQNAMARSAHQRLNRSVHRPTRNRLIRDTLLNLGTTRTHRILRKVAIGQVPNGAPRRRPGQLRAVECVVSAEKSVGMNLPPTALAVTEP